MASDNNKQQAAPGTDPKIDAIKQIIFGDNMQAYDEQFKELKEVMDMRTKEIEDKISSLKKELSSTLKELDDKFDKEISSVKEDLINKYNNADGKKVDKNLLGEMLQEIGKKIQAADS